MSVEYKNIQLVVTKEVAEILREEKKKQRKSMALIVEELILEKYSSLSYKLKQLDK